MKDFRNIITNTTSLVGYIAILMFAGAYVGGNQSYALDPTLLKGSVMEERAAPTAMETNRSSPRSAIITIDGRQYKAILGDEVGGKAEFRY